MKKRNIPKKNYFIVLLMTFFVVCLTFYFAEWYKIIKEHYENNSIIIDAISKIEEESISSYLLDNPNTVIYIASSNDKSIKKYESQMKKYINENGLNDEIVYFDTCNLDETYINEIFLKYLDSSLKRLKNISSPNILYFENGKITDVLNFKRKTITKNDSINFLERENVIVND